LNRSKTKGEGGNGGMTTISSNFNALYGNVDRKKLGKKINRLKKSIDNLNILLKEGFTYEDGITRDSEHTSTEDRKDVIQKNPKV
jgi:hypothetical protein